MSATITKPEQVSNERFQLFMIHTLAFQLEKWSQIPLMFLVNKDHREAIRHLHNKCRKLLELVEVAPMSKTEEQFFEVGDEFHAIMGFIQQQKDGHFQFNLMEVCAALATDDKEYLTEFFISAAKTFSDTPNLALLSAVTLYCPEMPMERRKAFAILLEKTMDNQRGLLGK